MDAKELRIGNWVQTDRYYFNILSIHNIQNEGGKADGRFIEIADKLRNGLSRSYISDLKGIPLTPEIFQKIKEANEEEFSFEWTKELGLYWDVWDGIYLEHIQNVHQFQNFYYMAENKELIVEL